MTERDEPRLEDDRYLWDRTGPADPEVARLEALLAPLAHPPERAFAPPAAAARPWVRLAAAAVVLVALGAGAAWLLARGGDEAPCDVPLAPGAIAVVADGGHAVAAGTWVDATGEPREVRFGDLGRVTLEPGTRVRLLDAGPELTRFFLERGSLEAFVSASARPRTFQVDTAAVRCVDLGCRYVLSVEPSGLARVRVTSGQVAFEVPGREVYVPAGAVCLAPPGKGPGTPRFEDAPAPFATALDAFDAAPARSDDRRDRALEVLALVESARDALPATHLLDDPDDAVASAALERLVARFGAPEGCRCVAGRAPREDLDLWRDRFSRDW